jgi:alkanesulfonate monooxygenase SsuD/methylene tetrahydromethanopterin reductase-like flavin-dependent oxidoreductase (luciferase family)
MKVGIYFDMRNPAPWRQDPARLYSFALEACEEAERQGINSIWVPEHHLFEEGHITRPLTMCAAIAARTKRVRIGTAVLLAPLYHPASLAEEATVVDLLSGGRLELGIGAGWRVPEFGLFGADVNKRYSTTVATVRELRRLWADPRVTPAPVQQRIPIWYGTMGPKNAYRAGELGEGLYSIKPELLEPYRKGLVAGGHDPQSARMSALVNAWISEDPDADAEVVCTHGAWWLDSYRRHAAQESTFRAPPRLTPAQARTSVIAEGVEVITTAKIPITTPEDAARQLKSDTAGLPVEHIFFPGRYAGMSESYAIRHIHTLAKKLQPLIA